MATMFAMLTEADDFGAALDKSQIAFAYFDMSDRLRFWNKAYEDLNIRIKPLIKDGAYFPDLLEELIIQGQIDIPNGETEAWIAKRIERRRVGGIDFRHISDGRTFLCQERHDDMGGTLGVWIDVTYLFNDDGPGCLGACLERPHVDFSDPGCQNTLRENLQTILGSLELLKATEQTPENALLIDQGLAAAETMGLSLDAARARDGTLPSLAEVLAQASITART